MRERSQTTPKLTYAEQLRHPNWQRRRLERLNASEFMCQSCLCEDKTLHVHHRRYVRGRMAWEYEDGDLQVLCEDCHSEEHGMRSQIDQLLTLMPSRTALALLSGYLAETLGEHAPGYVHDAFADNPLGCEAGALAGAAELLSIYEITDALNEMRRVAAASIERSIKETPQ